MSGSQDPAWLARPELSGANTCWFRPYAPASKLHITRDRVSDGSHDTARGVPEAPTGLRLQLLRLLLDPLRNRRHVTSRASQETLKDGLSSLSTAATSLFSTAESLRDAKVGCEQLPRASNSFPDGSLEPRKQQQHLYNTKNESK